jgi:hypothetical protein
MGMILFILSEIAIFFRRLHWYVWGLKWHWDNRIYLQEQRRDYNAWVAEARNTAVYHERIPGKRRLYVSVPTGIRADFNTHTEAFVAALEARGYDVYLTFEWRSYFIIEHEIDQSDAFLALADLNWFSSVWKACETTYALQGIGFMSRRKGNPVPTFIFWCEEPFNIGYLRREARNPNLIYLPQDAEQAANAITAFLDARK